MVVRIICYVLIVVCVSVLVIVKKRVDADTIKAIKKYAFLAVVEAQQIFGKDTGKLKHDCVLARLAKAFPDLFKLLKDDEIDNIIAQAKKKLNDMMANDEYIANAVNLLINDFSTEDNDDTQ